MADFYMSQAGDIAVAPHGDIALTDSSWREDSQQAYLRIMTEPGDFRLYPTLGVDLTTLYGLPQSRATGELGKSLIMVGLEREGMFSGRSISIDAVPTGPQTIRFDVYIASTTDNVLALSIEQDLGVQLNEDFAYTEIES